MRAILIILALGTAALGGAVQAQTPPTTTVESVITVTGSGHATQAPDYATLTFTVRGEGRTEVEALRAMSSTRDRVDQGLAALAGASRITLHTGALSVAPVRGPDCAIGQTYGEKPMLSTGACAPVGYVAQLAVSAEIRPAGRLGDAASLVVERGAVDVSLGVSGVDDQKALDARAARLAFDDARRQAEVLAAASGARLGPVLRMGRQSGMDSPYGEDAISGVAYMAVGNKPPPPVTPQVALTLVPPPVSSDSALTVWFQLLR